jgi:uncharacterized protein DUF6675
MVRLPLLVAMLLAPILCQGAGTAPKPPCGEPPIPLYPAAGQPPVADVWSESELRRAGWTAPDCLHWPPGKTRLIAALAGQFRFTGPSEELAARLGRISALKTVRYWSVSHQAWQALVSDAGLLQGPDGGARPDIGSAELIAGRSFYYFETDRHGRTVHRLDVLEHTTDRLVVATENVTPIRIGILTAFEGGALQSVVFLERRGAELWGYYQAIRATEGASVVALGSDASYVNRLAALYHHVAGLPTDREPLRR